MENQLNQWTVRLSPSLVLPSCPQRPKDFPLDGGLALTLVSTGTSLVVTVLVLLPERCSGRQDSLIELLCKDEAQRLYPRKKTICLPSGS